VTTEDYRQLSNRFARLAIDSAVPSVAEALMAIAFDYASRTAKADPGPPRGQRHHQINGFSD